MESQKPTMAQRAKSTLVRWGATILMAVGVSVFIFGMLGGILVLREGVTGLVGEGERLQAESPERIRSRLALVGMLMAVVPAGWLLARLGDAYSQPESTRRPRATRLAAELLFLIGGVAFAVGILTWFGPWAAGYLQPDVYRWIGICAVVGSPVFLGLGWMLFRWSARQLNPAEQSLHGAGSLERL